jgi:DNA-binding transcriptional ArsR family regulator
VRGIDLHAAVREHTDWTKKFFRAISEEQSLDASSISRDTSCALGEWLDDDARQAYRHLESYRDCLVAHTEFHVEAAKVARAINEKRCQEALRMLGRGSDYSRVSIALGLAIMRLMKAIAATRKS